MREATSRDDLTPDMTPGACTHRSMIRHLGGDASRWSCSDCPLEVGTDTLGRPLRPVHPLWPLSSAPQTERADADDKAIQVLSTEGAQCGDCGDQPGDRICPQCESCRRRYVTALRAAGWAPRAELQHQIDQANTELAAIKKELAGLVQAVGER